MVSLFWTLLTLTKKTLAYTQVKLFTKSKDAATTSSTMRCTDKRSIYHVTQQLQGKSCLGAINDVDQVLLRNPNIQDPQEFLKPVWTVPLNTEFSVLEEKTLYLERSVEPKEYTNLKIKWFFNGQCAKSLDHASNFKLTCDFGFA